MTISVTVHHSGLTHEAFKSLRIIKDVYAQSFVGS